MLLRVASVCHHLLMLLLSVVVAITVWLGKRCTVFSESLWSLFGLAPPPPLVLMSMRQAGSLTSSIRWW